MARQVGQVTTDTVFNCVDALLANLSPKDKEKPAKVLEVYTGVRQILQGEDPAAIESLVSEGRAYAKRMANDGKDPKKPGRQVSDAVLAEIKTMFGEKFYADFTAGKLDDKARKKALDGARAAASLKGTLPSKAAE